MFKLASRLLIREWRFGELRVLCLALVLSVACLSAIGFTIQRLQQAMEEQASALLGGDIVVHSTQPFPAAWLQKAKQLKIKTAVTVEFSSMVQTADKMQLASVKAVSNAYPLLGKIILGSGQNIASAPPPGQVWLEPRLFSALHITTQSKVQIGQMNFSSSQVLTNEPDYGLSWRNIAPRLLMNSSDLAATQVLQAGSRAEYRLLAIGQPEQLKQFSVWLKPQLAVSQSIKDSKTDPNRLNHTVNQLSQMLRLAGLLSLMLVGIAIASATRRYIARHMTTSSLFRCLGLKQGQVLFLFSFVLLTVGIVGAGIGCALGFLLQHFLSKVLSTLLVLNLPPATLKPALLAICMGLYILASFTFAPLLSLQKATPSNILRREPIKHSIAERLTYAIGYGATALLTVIYTQDVKLSLLLLSCLGCTLLVLIALAKLLLAACASLRPHVSMTWRYGLASLARHQQGSQQQIIAFGLIIMAITLLLLLQHDLLTTWRQRLSPGTPNYFAINIMPDEVPAVEQALKSQDIQYAGLFPMVRGRLTALNDTAIAPQLNKALQRELNLSWQARPTAYNEILQGEWWHDDKAWVSLEESLAHSIGAKPGDTLTFNVGNETISARLKNIRAVDWYSMQPNFFVIFSPKVLQSLPTTYIASFYLPAGQQEIANHLVERFPNISLLNIAQILAQVQAIIQQASWIVHYLLAFAISISLLILLAAIQASLDLRLYEGAIMRTLGMSRQQQQLSLATEYILLASLASIMGITSAVAASYFLAKHVLNVHFYVSFAQIAVVFTISITAISLFGIMASRAVIKQPPGKLLQDFS